VSENKDEKPKITRRKPRKKGWFDLDEKPKKYKIMRWKRQNGRPNF